MHIGNKKALTVFFQKLQQRLMFLEMVKCHSQGHKVNDLSVIERVSLHVAEYTC